jgi:DNA-binding response OmpR family regulator
LVTVSVLLVDDDSDFLALSTRVLEGMGAEVVATARDAESAIVAANDNRPEAVLVDVGLPDRDGIDLGAELAAMPWKPRVVLTSTDGDVDRDVESRGVNLPFVPKENLATDGLRGLLGED